ncbi:MAG: amidohydrolase family protein [Acidobacteriota bacterium]
MRRTDHLLGKAVILLFGLCLASTTAARANGGSAEAGSTGDGSAAPGAAAAASGPSGLGSALTRQQDEANKVALRCGLLIDGRSELPRKDATVLIGDGRIEAVGRNIDLPTGVKAIDLRRRTCLPGLIDLHVHLLLDTESDWGSLTASSAAKALLGLRNAQLMLRTGFTTVRSTGESDVFYALSDVRDAIDRGDFVGPRILLAPHMLSTTGGHGDFSDLAPDLQITIPGRVVDGPDEIRRAVREEIKHGADWIKLAATGGVMSAGDNPNVTAFTDEELRAAVDEAHRHLKKITVHAIGTEGIKAAIRAGVDSVEHGILIDEEGINLLLERGIYLVPTIYVLDYVVEVGPMIGYPKESVEKGRQLMVERDERMRRAFGAGVKVAFGSDTIFPHQQAPREFAELVRLGLTPMQAILAATINAAEVLDLDEEIGTIEAGKVADIVAVDDNPLDNIKTLEQVSFVMKDGTVVKMKTP